MKTQTIIDKKKSIAKVLYPGKVVKKTKPIRIVNSGIVFENSKGRRLVFFETLKGVKVV